MDADDDTETLAVGQRGTEVVANHRSDGML
jgi:hypothetical protein